MTQLMTKDTFSIWSTIIKALTSAGFTTAAVAYSAHGDPLMIGLTASAAAGITTNDVINS